MAEKKNIYLFHGDDSYSSQQKLQLWKKAFVEKHDDTNFETIEGKKLKVDEFQSNIETLPFLAEKRLIIIKNFLTTTKSEIQQEVSKSIEKTADHCIVVFYENKIVDKRSSLYKKIKKIGHVEEFNPPPPQEISKWIQTQARKNKLNIKFPAINYLSGLVKADLWTVANELEKLKIYAQEREVTNEMIDKLVTPSLSSSVFKLTDQITTHNSKAALQTLHILKESGEELGKIFYMIIRHFRILIQVKDLLSQGYSEGQMIKALKQHPFVIKKTAQQAKNFDQQNLNKIYNTLLEIDAANKTGKIKTFQKDDRQFRLAIEKLILEC